MNVIKRAIINITRQLVKSFSLLLLITFLGSIILTGITMSRAMIATEERLLMQVPAVSTIVYNGELSFGWGQPTRNEMIAVGNMEHVRSYDFTIQNFFYSQDLSWFNAMDPGHLTGRGVNNPAIADIESGMISILEGRTFRQEEIDNDALVMVIPQSIAIVNDLTIGSTIEIANIAHDYRWRGDWSDRFNEEFILDIRMLEFEVIGIYGAQVDESGLSFMGPIFFYLPFGVAESMLNFELQAMIEADEDVFRTIGQGIFQEEPFLDTLFVLNNPRDLEEFSNEASEILSDEWVIVGIDESVFAPIITSMDAVLEIANAIQVFAVIASIAVLTLTLLLFLRDRRHEIGVYIALGDKKTKVIIQTLLEVGIIAITGFVLAVLVGNMVSSLISNHLFEQHLINQFATQPISSMGVPWELTYHIPWGITVEDAMTLYDVSLSSSILLMFIGIGIIIVSISIIIPIWYALKLQPRDLLQQGKIG